MTDLEALGLTAETCIRTFGLAILTAEAVIDKGTPQWEYVQNQRKWLAEKQDMIEMEEMVNKAMGGGAR